MFCIVYSEKKDSSICKFIFYDLLDLDFHINVSSIIKVKQ